MTLEEEFDFMEKFIRLVNTDNKPWSIIIKRDNFGDKIVMFWYQLYVEGMQISDLTKTPMDAVRSFIENQQKDIIEDGPQWEDK